LGVDKEEVSGDKTNSISDILDTLNANTPSGDRTEKKTVSEDKSADTKSDSESDDEETTA